MILNELTELDAFKGDDAFELDASLPPGKGVSGLKTL